MTRHRLVASLISGAVAVAAAFAVPAWAQDVQLYRSGEKPNARDVARILGGEPTAPAAAAAQPDGESQRTRSLRGAGEQPLMRGFHLALPPQRAEPSRPTAIALPVQFAFDSADILPAARAQLDALAEGIKLLAPERRVVIEGHTDASGAPEYNLALSRRRAASVRQYLIDVHRIEGRRLDAIGLGQARPLDRNDPYATENRRVQFHGG